MRTTMRRAVSLVACIALLLGFAPATRVSADPGDGHVDGVTDPLILALVTNDDLFSLADLTAVLGGTDPQGPQRYGPFASGSPDSGTCGNDWAQDTFDRWFTVRQSGPASSTVVEQFKNGAFATNAGTSPGACDSSDGTPPGTLVSGLTGTMHGYLIISVSGTQTSTSPDCVPAGPRTTSGFLARHFARTSRIRTLFFPYARYDTPHPPLC